MSDIRVATRYARSLFDMAEQSNTLEKTEQDAALFLETCTQSRAFDNMLKSPVVFPDKKKAVFKRLFEANFQPVTMSFLDIVLRKRREIVLKAIFTQFMEMYRTKKGILPAHLYTAIPVSADLQKEINTYLEKKTSKTIELHTGTRPELIGGFVIQYEDKLIDASVSTKLRTLRKQLLNNN